MITKSRPAQSFALRQSRTRYMRHCQHALGELVENLWDDPQALQATGIELRCSGFRQTVRLECAGEQFVMKRYLEPRLVYKPKRAVLSSRARHTWNIAQRLVAMGIATPQPVAYVENRIGPFRRDSFLVYPYIPGETLQSTIASQTAAGNFDYLEYIWGQIGQMWEVFEAHRISHGDASTGNFIVTPGAVVVAIDIDGIHFHMSPRATRRHLQKAWRFLSQYALLDLMSIEDPAPTAARPNARPLAA